MYTSECEGNKINSLSLFSDVRQIEITLVILTNLKQGKFSLIYHQTVRGKQDYKSFHTACVNIWFQLQMSLAFLNTMLLL